MIAWLRLTVHLSDRVHGVQELQNKVGGILEVIQTNEVLLDVPCTNETIEDVNAASLIVRARALMLSMDPVSSS
jgi:hypothetical protein